MQRPIEKPVGTPARDIDTPALLVDLDRLDMSIGMNVSVTERCGDTQSDVWTNIQPQMLDAGGIEKIVDVSEFLNDTYIAVANDFDRDEVASEINAWAADNM